MKGVMNKKTTLSICVSALNEEENIASTVEELIANLDSRVAKLEIIIVDDGSKDLTFQIAQDLSEKYSQVAVASHDINYGIGQAYRTALSRANGEYFTWFPADGEDSVETILLCLEHVDEDVAVTSYHKGYDKRSLFRKGVSSLYTIIINIIFGYSMKYYNGVAIFPAEKIKQTNGCSKGFFFNAENIIRFLKLGGKIKQIRTPLKKRGHGKSKAISFRSLWQVFSDCLFMMLSVMKIKTNKKQK